MRRWIPVLLLALPGGACAEADVPEDAQEAAGIDVEVPEGWTRSDPEVTADVLEALRWQSEDDPISSLQVVAGCAQATSADELLAGAAMGERPLPVVGAEAAPEEIEVAGLEEARRVVFVLGAGEDDVRARMAGLYGVGDGVLVLVELLRPAARFAHDEADEVLDSVRVDTGALAPRCEGRDEADTDGVETSG